MEMCYFDSDIDFSSILYRSGSAKQQKMEILKSSASTSKVYLRTVYSMSKYLLHAITDSSSSQVKSFRNVWANLKSSEMWLGSPHVASCGGEIQAEPSGSEQLNRRGVNSLGEGSAVADVRVYEQSAALQGWT